MIFKSKTAKQNKCMSVVRGQSQWLTTLALFNNNPLARASNKVSMTIESLSRKKKVVVVLHRGRCNNKVYDRLSHDVITRDVDRDVSTT